MLLGLVSVSLGGLLLSSLALLALFLALLEELLFAGVSCEFIWGIVVDLFEIVLSFLFYTILLF